MNKASKKLSYTHRIVDLVVVFSGWLLAYYMRFEMQLAGRDFNVSFERYIGFGCFLSLVTLITLKNLRHYESTKFESATKEILNTIKGNLVAFLLFLSISFFYSEGRLSRLMLGYYFSISTILLIIVKMYFRTTLLNMPIKVVLVGHGESIKKYYNIIKDYKNYNIMDWFDSPSDLEFQKSATDFDPKVLEREQCDAIVIGYNTSESNQAQTYIEQISKYLIPILILPDVEYGKLGFNLQNFRGLPVISLNEPKAKPLGLLLKRIFDFFACSIGILIISPLLILLALLVKLTSKGPIFYGQVRMGVDGKEFKMWKFRSMVVGEANQEGWTVKDDPRVTPIGKFIRKTSLDELPQLWNVIVGDMSLVGPRPERPKFVEQFREEIPDYMLRHKFKAGITGWAQINGWRGDTSIEKRIECDIWYIKNWSFALDISIIFLTFWKGFINKNAY